MRKVVVGCLLAFTFIVLASCGLLVVLAMYNHQYGYERGVILPFAIKDPRTHSFRPVIIRPIDGAVDIVLALQSDLSMDFDRVEAVNWSDNLLVLQVSAEKRDSANLRMRRSSWVVLDGIQSSIHVYDSKSDMESSYSKLYDNSPLSVRDLFAGKSSSNSMMHSTIAHSIQDTESIAIFPTGANTLYPEKSSGLEKTSGQKNSDLLKVGEVPSGIVHTDWILPNGKVKLSFRMVESDQVIYH